MVIDPVHAVTLLLTCNIPHEELNIFQHGMSGVG